MQTETTANKSKPLNPIEKARRNPKSRAMALRGYYYDWVGIPGNGATRELREEYKQLCRAARGRLAATVKAICFQCVGGDADSGPRISVRDCAIERCPLRPVRPWQGVKGRNAKTAAVAFCGDETDTQPPSCHRPQVPV